jgi:hypothetical protein
MRDQPPPHRRAAGTPPVRPPTMTGVIRDLTDHGWSPDRIARTLGITVEQVHHLLAASDGPRKAT